MHLSPDEVIYWQHNFLKLNSTIVTTWGLMLVMAVGARLITRRLSSDINIPRWQNLLEIVISGIRDQSADIGLRRPERFLGFIGTVFLFIAFANLCFQHSRDGRRAGGRAHRARHGCAGWRRADRERD